MVTIVSGRTLPVVSETDPVMPPNVFCALALGANASREAARKATSPILLIIYVLTSRKLEFRCNSTLTSVEGLLQGKRGREPSLYASGRRNDCLNLREWVTEGKHS